MKSSTIDVISLLRDADPVALCDVLDDAKRKADDTRRKLEAQRKADEHLAEVKATNEWLMHCSELARESAARAEAQRKAMEAYQNSDEHRAFIAEQLSAMARTGS